MTQEALKLAEDYAHMRAIWYVESLYGTSASHTELREKVMLGAHQALKEALAQPEQEPVATVTSESGNADVKMSWWHEPALPVGTKLYTTPPQPEQEPVAWEQFYPDIGKPQLTYPPQGIYYTPPQRTWQGLTNEDISEVVRGTHNTGSFVRAIEAKLREKNSQHKEKNT